MFLSGNFGINEEGHLTLGGCDTTALARTYGTPYICYDETQIRENCRAFTDSLAEYYGGNGLVCYACKAFSCLEICRLCKDEKMGLDVVSGGEIYTAVKAGFPAERICFHGNNKTDDELTMALDNNIGRIVVDNIEELGRLSKLASKTGKTVKIMLRIKPGISAHTHKLIQTGQIDSKFGFALETGEAMLAVKQALSSPNLELTGVHCHIGSQILEIEPFELAAGVMLGFIADIRKQTGCEMEELNLGGGFGIRYADGDRPQSLREYMRRICEAVRAGAELKNIKLPYLYVEPGRSLVGEAAVTVYTVGSVKHIPGVRTFVSVDGGMLDNPRYILYQSDYRIVCANRADVERTEKVTVAGRYCESGDLIQENVFVQKVEAGDLLAVFSTGAYNYSMASNYNRVSRPVVLMAKDGAARAIIERETYEDITKNDV